MTVGPVIPDSATGRGAWLLVAVLVAGCGGSMAKPHADAGVDGSGCPAPGSIRAGGSCERGRGCPQDTSATPGVCGCVSGSWHCSYTECPTSVYWGIMSDGRECAFIDFPAGCACASQYYPQQGHSYCICALSSGSDAGFD